VRVARKLAAKKPIATEARENAIGYEIVLKALEAPLRQIVVNVGKNDGSVVVNKVMESENENAGYNAVTDQYIDDMVKAGIIDPVKVTRTALQNAVSAAAILLTTEVAIADELKDEKPMGGGMPGGMGGMGGMDY